VTGWRSAALAASCLVLVTGSAVAADREEFRLQDPAISESSGLLALPDRVLTVNDSGHDPVLYVVDRKTGRTEEAFTFTSEEVIDVEALSWGIEGEVWIGDIGDNNAERDELTLYRSGIPGPAVRLAPATPYRVNYDDGAHDAEALMFDGEGRVLIASKGIFTGRLYRSMLAPMQQGVTVLHPIGRVPGLVTDGAFSDDGSVLYLRTYGVVAAYTYPELDHLGTFPLPAQDQGEGLAVDGAAHLLVSSEGIGQPVYWVDIPESMRQPERTTPETAPETTEPPTQGAGGSDDDHGSRWTWPAALAVLLAAVATGTLAIRGARRRSRHTR
jgi:hypothetical protein